jgi:ATP-dependent exoDNAse (exonuclease V) beta subunit
MDVALKRMTNFKITDNIVNLACMLKSSELIVYKASAGSGKTYALAREFLKIVLANPFDYKRILAVTFTRKATEEMKSRIIENLAQLKNKDPKSQHLRKEIIHSLQPIFPDISMHLDNNAALALELILHDYSNFNISTIDSFFQSIIRAFAKELDLPIGMEIELDTQSALAAAVEQVLKAYESGKDEISQWIEDFVSDRIDEDKNWKIEDSLLQFSRELFNEDFRNIANEFCPKPTRY